jgi:hypothetical protein
MRIITERKEVEIRYVGEVECPSCGFHAHLSSEEMGKFVLVPRAELNGLCLRCGSSAAFRAWRPDHQYTAMEVMP